MSKIGTKVLFILPGDKLLVGQNSLSYKETVAMIEISSKTSGKWSEFEAGRGSFTVSVGGIASTSKEATKAGWYDLKAASDARQSITCVFGEFTDETAATETVGSEHMTVNCFVSGLGAEYPDNATNTFTCDLQGTGAPSHATISGS